MNTKNLWEIYQETKSQRSENIKKAMRQYGTLIVVTIVIGSLLITKECIDSYNDSMKGES